MIMMLQSPSKINAQKTKPRCPYVGECGGCDYQDLPYGDELRLKEDVLAQLLSDQIGPAAVSPIIPSPQEYYYRQRIDLKLQRTRIGVLIGFTPKSGRGILSVDRCAIALPEINEKISAIKRE